jgi:hypothetical protein
MAGHEVPRALDNRVEEHAERYEGDGDRPACQEHHAGRHEQCGRDQLRRQVETDIGRGTIRAAKGTGAELEAPPGHHEQPHCGAIKSDGGAHGVSILHLRGPGVGLFGPTYGWAGYSAPYLRRAAHKMSPRARSRGVGK